MIIYISATKILKTHVFHDTIPLPRILNGIECAVFKISDVQKLLHKLEIRTNTIF